MFRVSGFRIFGFFRVFRVSGLGVYRGLRLIGARVYGLRFRGFGLLGFRVSGFRALGFRVCGFGL